VITPVRASNRTWTSERLTILARIAARVASVALTASGALLRDAFDICD